MADTYQLTIQGLIRKRAELAGQVEALHFQLSSLMAQLTAIDSSIRVFRPDIDLADLPEKVPPAPFTAFRGEFQRFLLDTLRQAEGARLSTFDLTEAVMERRALDPADRIIFRLISRRTGYALCKMRRKGMVQSRRLGGNNGVMEWCIA